jgi:hypothetical protein
LDQRVAKWRRWLEGQMRNEILTMNLHRSFWQQTQGIIVANETLPPSSWWEFISDLYGSSQASAVRRLVDPHDNGVSLRRMLDEMMQEPHLLTFDYFIGLIPPQPPSLGPACALGGAITLRATSIRTSTRSSSRPISTNSPPPPHQSSLMWIGT